MPGTPPAQASSALTLPTEKGPLVPTDVPPVPVMSGSGLTPGATASGAPPVPGTNPAVPDTSKIEPLPGAPGAPPLPAPPPIPDATAESNPQPEKPVTEVKAVTHKKHRHVKVAKTQDKAKAANATATTSTYFRSERLPDTIYRKSYDTRNKHLPKAYYERDYDGLVFLSAQHDDIDGLRAMLDAGRDMELVDSEGDTPLLVAVKHNAINTTRLLLARHANFNVTDRNGMTPAQIASQNRNFPIERAIEAAEGTQHQ